MGANEAATVEATFDGLTPQAVAEAQRVIMQRTIEQEPRTLILPGLLLILALVLFGVWLIIGPPGQLLSLLAPFGALLLMLLIGFVLTRRSRRQIATDTGGPITVRLGPDGIESRTPLGEARYRWAAVLAAGETENHFLWIIGRHQFVAVPLDAFADPGALAAFRAGAEAHRPIPPMTRRAIRQRQRARHRNANRVAGGLLVVLLIAIGLFLAAPWRASIELGPGDRIRYVEAVTGGMQAMDELPIIVFLHGYGSFPELIRHSLVRRLDLPARVVFPAAPHRWLLGYSWDTWDEDEEPYEEFGRQYRQQAERIAALGRALRERHPGARVQVLSGFSQGGTLTWTTAAYHGDAFDAFVPMAGSLAEDLQPGTEAHDHPIHGVHGSSDQLMPPEWAVYARETLADAGFNVTLAVVPGVQHRPGDAGWAAWSRAIVPLLAGREDVPAEDDDP